MVTTIQNTGQANNLWSYTFNAPISGTYSEIVYNPSFLFPLERINQRTTFIFFTPFIKKETEISNQTTSLLFQIPEHDKKRISKKLQNKYYYLLFYIIASNLKDIPSLYQDYYIKVHLERDIEIKSWEETVFSIVVPNMDLNDKILLWERIENIIDKKIREIDSKKVDKLRESFTIEID